MAAILWGEPASEGLDPPNSLASPRPDPANRFWEFVPDVDLIGPRRTALGDASQHVFTFRTDYTAKFVIRHLSPTQQDDMLGCKLWLMQGGEVTVETDDATSVEYEGLTLRPGTTPIITNEDDIQQHFRFECELRSTTALVVNYSA